MATPALDHMVRLRPGASHDLDEVMEVMDAAFGSRFGEAWTRSQCAGILPMTGVSLIVARDGESGAAMGFTLSRSVADESELLLLAVLLVSAWFSGGWINVAVIAVTAVVAVPIFAWARSRLRRNST